MTGAPPRQGFGVAYFSMEIALDRSLPTYAGGLGVLAGDTLRAAADHGLPLVGITLLHRNGYFRQRLDAAGNQYEESDAWTPGTYLTELPQRAAIELEGRVIVIRAWRYLVRGAGVDEVPVYLLDTMLPENSAEDQQLTNVLYGGDQRYRLMQEAILGMGGVAMLRALGHADIATYHLNEGHSALLTLALLREQLTGRRLSDATDVDLAEVRQRCVFTTHTPVPEGHDQFPIGLVQGILGAEAAGFLDRFDSCPDGCLNMTYLALFFSRFINGVAMRHGEISRGMFPGYPINSITNGVHVASWTTPSFSRLFDQHIPGWRTQNSSLRYAVDIPLHEVHAAHEEAKEALIREVARRTGHALVPRAMTLGFARRATAYKRADLIFSDLDRLRALASRVGPLQIVFAGKAHPRDESGKALIREVFQAASVLGESVPVVYLENYDTDLARILCGGSDLWLNTPLRPREASGTSGMKAAVNGVPSLSILDGWWIEGHAEGVTGWSVGDTWEAELDPARDADALYDKLERVVLPTYYGRPSEYDRVRRAAIQFNGSFFTTERMILEYARNAYRS